MNARPESESRAQWVQVSSDHYINLGLADEVADVRRRLSPQGEPVDALEVRWASGREPLLLVGAERDALVAHLARLKDEE